MSIGSSVKPIIGITMGDFNGIGPEVTLKSVLTRSIRNICVPILIGSLDVYEWYARRLKFKIIFQEISSVPSDIERDVLPVLPIRAFQKPRISPGWGSEESGAYAGESIERAVELCLRKNIEAMVTAPVSKSVMAIGGYRSSGQTEMIARLSGASKVAMLLVAGDVRVCPATVHIPLKHVHETITKELLFRKLEIIHSSLRHDFGIRSPKIAVLGLNPHAGEDGMFGDEEEKHILPAIRRSRNKRIKVDGPFPADGFFGNQLYRRYDAILAMYHDQGLIPLKLMGFERGVNYSAGLSIVRTSPDHGTAFDIAGRRIANPQSMMEAIKLAIAIVKNRRKNKR